MRGVTDARRLRFDTLVGVRRTRREVALDKLALFDEFGFLRHATPEARAAAERSARPVTLPPGAFVFRDGDRCEQFALIGRGRLRVFKTGESGRELSLYHVQAGEICPMNTLCVLLGTPARASALVEAPLAALLFPRPVLVEWLRTDDALRSFIFEAFSQRLVDVMTLVEEVAFNKMDTRLAQLLCRLFANNGAPLTAISTTHEELAAELGTVREVVSRLLREFERLGALETARGRILLRDEAVLRRFAQALESARLQPARRRTAGPTGVACRGMRRTRSLLVAVRAKPRRAASSRTTEDSTSASLATQPRDR